MSSKQGGTKAKAQTASKIDDNIKANVIALLNEHPKIPSICWADFYYYKFEEVFCAASLGFEHGLAGFMKTLDYMVDEITDDQGMYWYKIKDRYRESYARLTDTAGRIVPNKALELLGQTQIARQILGDPELWRGKFEQLKLVADKLRIVLSPLEQAYKRNSMEVHRHVLMIHNKMVTFSHGIRLNEIHRHVKISPAIFNQLSFESFVVEFPELFYRVDPINETGDNYDEPLVYDGFTHTLSRNQLEVRANIENMKLVYFSITSGIYHKTLLLLNAAGSSGLKITVWFDSIRQNWTTEENKMQDPDVLDPFDTPAIDVAKALYTFKLLTISSNPRNKNDLRLFFPLTKPNFVELMGLLSDHISEYRRNQRLSDASRVSSPDSGEDSTRSGTSGSC